MVIPNFLTPQEVDYIHGYAQNLEIITAKIGNNDFDVDGERARQGDDGGAIDESIRQSTNRWLDHSDPRFDPVLKQKIQDGMMSANQQAGWNYELEHMETWQYTIYEHQPNLPSGDFYTWHTDSSADLYPNGMTRKLSASIQLSPPEDYEGGHFQWIETTDVFDQIKFNQDACEYIDRLPYPKSIPYDKLVQTAPFSGKELGSLLVFPSWLHHQVTPVTRGVRKSLVIWNTGWPLR